MRQLPLSFSYQASGRIWHIEADLPAQGLGIEVRTELQEASFAYLCPTQDKVIFEGLALEGSLLTSLIGCQHQVMLLQQYDSLESLTTGTTLALQAQDQQVLWAVEHYRHHFFHAWESIGKSGNGQPEEENWVALHLVEGSIRELEEAEVNHLLLERQQIKEEGPGMRMPLVYEEGEEHFATVAQFLQLYLKVNAQKNCEYLHVFDKIVISFYTAEVEKLANHIAVFDADGNLLLHQLLAEDLQKPGSDTFMVWNHHLFFIENSICLKGYNLQ